MEPVCEKKLSYPRFLWITTCKILFIVGDNVGKTERRFVASPERANKNPSVIMLLFRGFSLCTAALHRQNRGGYFLSNSQAFYDDSIFDSAT